MIMKMRSATYRFRDQVNAVTEIFKSWNECEQTVVLYSLARILNATQAKFLMQVIENSFSETADILLTERNANDPKFVASLCQQSKEQAVASLLALLPLLKAGNQEAKDEFIKILPKILTHSFENGCHIEESRQLLSFSLIHPAMNGTERAQFKLWLSHLEEHFEYQQYQGKVIGGGDEDISHAEHLTTPQELLSEYIESKSDASHNDMRYLAAQTELGMEAEHIPLYMTYSSPPNLASTSQEHQVPSSSLNPPTPIQLQQPPSGGHRKLMRSASLIPPANAPPTSANVSDWLNKHRNEMMSQSQQEHGPPDESGLNDYPHPPLSPQSSNGSSGSEREAIDGQNQRNTFLEENSGMRDVPIWLKSLRLHKYAYLFQQMTYEQMLGLTEEWLEQQNVTKGARHKIVLSIEKLRKRSSQLQAMEKDILESGNLRQALTDIKSMLNTPIKAYSFINKVQHNKDNSSPPANDSKDSKDGDGLHDSDLPGQITRVIGKLCTQLLVTAWPDDECFALYLQLLDKSLAHEAFTPDQKKKLATWKQQIQKNWHPPPQKFALDRQRKAFNALFPSMLANNPVMRSRAGVQQAAAALRGAQLQQHPQLAASASFGEIPPKPKQQQAKWAFGGVPPTATIGGQQVPGPLGNNLPVYRINSLNAPYTSNAPASASAVAAAGHTIKQAVGRTHSAPISKTSPYANISVGRGVADMTVAEGELTARLDSLCLSMTEHALGANSSNPSEKS